MEELLSLKWNNHRSTFLHILGVLRDKQAYTDVTLACDGKFYSVHKLVLSTCSDYFCAMFDKTACKSPVIVLKDIKSEDLEALLDYMYLGEVNVRQSDLASLIKAAENLRIKGLAVPDDEPPKKGSAPSSRTDTSRREGGSGSPPSKRKRRDEGEDGREDVRPPPPSGGGLHTPPPPSSRPKSPISQRLSPSPLRTSQESLMPEDRDSRPLSSPAESPAASHLPSHQSSQQLPHQSSQSSQPLPDQHEVTNQYRGEETPTFVKVEMEEETDDMQRDSYNMSGDGYKEENSGGDLGGDLSNDLPEFLQQAASGALASTSASYHHAFAGPSGFQPDVSGWQGDSQSLPGSFSGLGFQQPSSQDNPPGIGAEPLGNVCKVCGKVFNGRNWKQNLEYHFLTHTKEKPFKCPICLHSSALKYNLIRHIRNRHRDLVAPSQGQAGTMGGFKASSQGTSYQGTQLRRDRDAAQGSDGGQETTALQLALDQALSCQGTRQRRDKDAASGGGQDTAVLQFALDQSHAAQGTRLPGCSDTQITTASEIHPPTSHKLGPAQDNSSLVVSQKPSAPLGQVNALSPCQNMNPSQCGQKAVAVGQTLGFLSGGEQVNSEHGGASCLGGSLHQHQPHHQSVKQQDTHTFTSQEMSLLQSHDLQLSID